MVVVIVPSIVVVVVPFNGVAVDADEEVEEVEEAVTEGEEDDDDDDNDDGDTSIVCMQSSMHMDVKYCRANSICSANNRQTLTLK
jgi:hypothetical protein